MKTYTIDLTKVHSYYELHEHLMEVLPLPDYYGRNMDALWDSLHCWFDEPVTIEVKGFNTIGKEMEGMVQSLCGVLADLQKEDGVVISYL